MVSAMVNSEILLRIRGSLAWIDVFLFGHIKVVTFLIQCTL